MNSLTTNFTGTFDLSGQDKPCPSQRLGLGKGSGIEAEPKIAQASTSPLFTTSFGVNVAVPVTFVPTLRLHGSEEQGVKSIV